MTKPRSDQHLWHVFDQAGLVVTSSFEPDGFEVVPAIRAVYDAGMTDAMERWFEWADASPAVTWTGRLGLKERWEHRDDPEYQKMLAKLGGGS